MQRHDSFVVVVVVDDNDDHDHDGGVIFIVVFFYFNDLVIVQYTSRHSHTRPKIYINNNKVLLVLISRRIDGSFDFLVFNVAKGKTEH